eukprot:3623666-Prorocentrum_lima.AAC.1
MVLGRASSRTWPLGIARPNVRSRRRILLLGVHEGDLRLRRIIPYQDVHQGSSLAILAQAQRMA